MTLESQRLDLWLYYARFAKTRSLCASAIEKGHMFLNSRRLSKCHTKIRIGDVLTFPAPGRPSLIKVWRIEKFGIRRGPATEAATLYSEITE